MNFLCQIVLLLAIGSLGSSEITIEQLPSPRSLCGEGPFWDESSQSLYYIDIYGPESTILRYDFNENKTYAATVDNEPLMTFVLLVKGKTDQFLVGTKNEAKIIQWDGKSSKGQLVRTAFKVGDDKTAETNRFNDAKADPAGRFFGGTQRLSDCDAAPNLPFASLYSFDKKCGVKKQRDNIFISNGLTWVQKTNKFYYIDSCTHDVKEFDYDVATGHLSNERVLLSIKENGTSPDYVLDGMTNDLDGNLYIATYGGHKIMKVDSKTGQVLLELQFEPSQVTSVAFGGPNLDILFATTASRGPNPDSAGHLFKITGLGSIGSPSVKVKV